MIFSIFLLYIYFFLSLYASSYPFSFCACLIWTLELKLLLQLKAIFPLILIKEFDANDILPSNLWLSTVTRSLQVVSWYLSVQTLPFSVLNVLRRWKLNISASSLDWKATSITDFALFLHFICSSCGSNCCCHLSLGRASGTCRPAGR